MAAPNTDLPTTWEIVKWVGGGLGAIGVIAWGAFWKWLNSKASKKELADIVESFKQQNEYMLQRVDEHYDDAANERDHMRAEARDQHDKLAAKVDEISRGQGACMVALSHIQGRLDEQDQQNR